MRTPSSQKCRLDLAPPWADRFIFGNYPIDCGPVLLRRPFGFHLAMDTLPSEVQQAVASGRSWLYPAFAFVPTLFSRGQFQSSPLPNSGLDWNACDGRVFF